MPGPSDDTASAELPHQAITRTRDALPPAFQAPGSPPSPGVEAPGPAFLGADDRFEITGVLGQGGMGTVYRARDRQLNRLVAIKLMARWEEDRVQRFLREGEINAGLDHPHVLRVHEQGEWQGRAYLVAELIEGARTLHDVLPELDPRRRLALIRDAALGLGHAHQAGVVHRDVKPANLLVDSEGRLRVADFGVALKEGQGRLTASGMTVGTPVYMSPEQITARRELIGPPCDVWSLGVILYEALAGRRPFQADRLHEQAVLVTQSPLVRPPGLTDSTWQVLSRALAKEPGDRYANGDELAAALGTVLAGDSPLTGGPRRWATPLLLLGLSGAGVVALAFAAQGLSARSARPSPATAAIGSAVQPAPDGTRPAGGQPSTGEQAGLAKPLLELRTREPVDQVRFVLGRAFLSLGEGRARLWSPGGLPLQAWPTDHDELVVNRDGSLVFLRTPRGTAVRRADGSLFKWIDPLLPRVSAIGPAGKIALTRDREVAVLDLSRLETLHEVTPHRNDVTGVGFLGSAGEFLLTVADDQDDALPELGITRLADLEVVASHQLPFDARGLVVAAGPQRFAVRFAGQQILLGASLTESPIALTDPQASRLLPLSHAGEVRDFCFSPDGALLFSVSRLGSEGQAAQVNAWDAASGELVARLLPRFEAPGWETVACSPDGSRLAVGGGRRLEVWLLSELLGSR